MKNNLIKNTLIISIGKISTQFLTFLLLPLYTTYLSKSEFGSVDLILTYSSLLAPVITLQLEMGVFRHLIDTRGNRNQSVRVISSTFRLVASALAALSLLALLLHQIMNVRYFGYLIAITLSVIVINILLQIARGFGDNIKYSIASMVAGFTTIALNIILIVFAGMGAKGMMLAIIGGNLLAAIYLFLSLKIYKYIDFSVRDKELEKTLLKYSMPLIPNGVSWWAINAADRTIIAIVLGVASNGVYAVAYKFPSIFSSLFSFFNMAWTESASVNINAKDRNEFFSESMDTGLKLFSSLALCVIAGVSVFFGFLVNSSYNEAYLYIPILMLGAFFGSLVSMYGAIYIAKKMTRQVMNSSVIAAIITIATTLLLIPMLKLYAPAIGMVLSYGSMVVYRHFDVKKYVKITYSLKTITSIIAASSIVVTLYYLNHPIVNVINLCLSMTIAYLMNRDLFHSSLKVIFRKLRPVSVDREVAIDTDKGIE